MKGFAVLLALVSVALLLACGPPAAVQGEDQIILQSEFIGVGATVLANDQTPEVPPAGLQVVPDPGSCSGQLEAVACINLSKLKPVQRGRNIIRQGVRLLNFLPCC